MNSFIDTLNSLDQEMILFLNGLGTPLWDGFWLFVTNKWAAIPLYAWLCWLCYKHHSLKRFFFILLCVAVMIALTDQLSNLFKVQFHRLRPCHNPLINGQLRFTRCGGQFGYFSAHAANTFALAMFLGQVLRPLYSRLFIILLLWAAVVSYSRIYLGGTLPLRCAYRSEYRTCYRLWYVLFLQKNNCQESEIIGYYSNWFTSEIKIKKCEILGQSRIFYIRLFFISFPIQ